jgi:hypothetical protein
MSVDRHAVARRRRAKTPTIEFCGSCPEGHLYPGPERAACDDLTRELGYLPLALEQVAAYIAAPVVGEDFTGYLRLYREATAELLARKALGSNRISGSS